jgi:hypothetical protein
LCLQPNASYEEIRPDHAASSHGEMIDRHTEPEIPSFLILN